MRTCCINGLETFSRGDIPNSNQSIMTGRHETGSIPIKGYGGNGIGMHGQGRDAFPTADIPQFDRFVKAPRNEQIVINFCAKDKIIVSPQFDYTITGHCIPQSHCLIIGRCRHER